MPVLGGNVKGFLQYPRKNFNDSNGFKYTAPSHGTSLCHPRASFASQTRHQSFSHLKILDTSEGKNVLNVKRENYK